MRKGEGLQSIVAWIQHGLLFENSVTT